MPTIRTKQDLLQFLTELGEAVNAPQPPSEALVKEFGLERAKRMINQSLETPDVDPVQLVGLGTLLGVKGAVGAGKLLLALQAVSSKFLLGAARRPAESRSGGAVPLPPIPTRSVSSR